MYKKASNVNDAKYVHIFISNQIRDEINTFII